MPSPPHIYIFLFRPKAFFALRGSSKPQMSASLPLSLSRSAAKNMPSHFHTHPVLICVRFSLKDSSSRPFVQPDRESPPPTHKNGYRNHMEIRTHVRRRFVFIEIYTLRVSSCAAGGADHCSLSLGGAPPLNHRQPECSPIITYKNQMICRGKCVAAVCILGTVKIHFWLFNFCAPLCKFGLVNKAAVCNHLGLRDFLAHMCLQKV